MHYCAYQERCISELHTKFKEWEVPKNLWEALINNLQDDNFVNELRFAESYVRGKFRQKKWGKIKITQNLREKQISPKTIDKALQEIPQKEYKATQKQLIERKKKNLKDTKNTFQFKQKVVNYMVQKGYSSTDIWKYLNKAK